MSVQACALPDRTVEGLGPIAKFDALSKNSACKQLYLDGTPYERTELVQKFCGRFKGGDIPERCRCYRFKDTDDFQKYRSLWEDMLDTERTGEGDSPLVGSYTCFYEGCKDPNVYKTARMEADGQSCPPVVYCKQNVGDINVQNEGIPTSGKSLSDINIEIGQQCGLKEDRPDPNDKPNGKHNRAGGIPVAWLVAGGVAVLLLVIVLVVVMRSGQ